VTTDLLIISTVNTTLVVKDQHLKMEPGSALGILFTEYKPINVSFHPPVQLKI